VIIPLGLEADFKKGLEVQFNVLLLAVNYELTYKATDKINRIVKDYLFIFNKIRYKNKL
jgi:hypothetical protein